jgi:hypothetical protein
MSSWDPPGDKNDGSSHDPGVKEREVTDERDLSATLYNLDWTDYLLIGIGLSIPASILTALFLWEFFPEFQDTAGDIVRGIIDFVTLL